MAPVTILFIIVACAILFGAVNSAARAQRRLKKDPPRLGK